MSKGWSLCASTPWLIPAGWRYRPMRRTFMQGALEHFFGIPSTSVCSLFFFGRSRKNTIKNLKLVFASGCFCLFMSELGWSVVMCCMERWQKPQWTVPCLQTSCQQTFRVATFVGLRNSAIHSAPAAISEMRSPSANIKRSPKNVAKSQGHKSSSAAYFVN